MAAATINGVEYPAEGDVVTTYAYGATTNGHRETRTTMSGSLSAETFTQYDKAGRVIAERDASGLQTTYTYAYVDWNRRVVTVTRPGAATEITTHWRDGGVKSVTGTGVVHQYHDRGVTDGLRWNISYSGPDLDESPAWSKTTLDPLGRTLSQQRPGYDSSTVTTTYEYNALGQLIRTGTTGQGDTVYQYDELGHMFRSGLDADGTTGLALNSQSDRITDRKTSYYKEGDDWWRKSETHVYGTPGEATATPTGEEWTLLTGFDVEEGEIARSKSIDVHGNETITSTVIDRGSGDAHRVVVQTVNVPGSSTAQVTITRNGLLQRRTSSTGLTTVYGYDSLGRQTTVTDPRGNTTTTAYYASGTGTKGKVQSVVDASGNRTCYKYYGATGQQVEVITGADGSCEGGQSQYFAYSGRGELTRTWGDSPYPVEYGYDDYGRRVSMKTFRGGSGWEGLGWPANPGTADETEWVFEEATGLLLSKVYADNTHVDYTYTPAGKLATRTWARQVGASQDKSLITEYVYDPATGDLTQIKYYHDDHSTPDPDTQWVYFIYDRLGRHESIADALGSRTFGYNAALQVQTEDIRSEDEQGPWGYDKLITRTYEDGTGGTLAGRSSGFEIGTAEDTDEDYATGYHYDSLGRLERVTGPGLPAYGVQYTRLVEDTDKKSDMVESLAYKSDGSTTLASTTRGYQEDRDLLASVQNVVQGTPNVTVSKYEYQLDPLGRRTSVVQTGTAFVQDHLWKWSYNDRSELIGANRHEGTQLEEPLGNQMSPGAYTYNYDPIGNRLMHRVDNDASRRWYCANNVNQYTAIDDEASTCPTPSTPTEELVYDADGNLVADGTRVYSWDAENRLVAVAPASPAAGDKKVVFTYDYMSRRVQKRVFAWDATLNGGAGDWEANPEVYQRFVYDQWNVVLVLDGPNRTITHKYTWGLDLSGLAGQGAAGFSPRGPSDGATAGIHGAGGIGGLVAVEAPQAEGDPLRHWYFYDGNGNVGQLLAYDATGPTVNATPAAKYEYDPYGQLVNWTDNIANPFRFSTKWFDTTTGLGYWGYRYYSPRLGRWMSRDPIGERGGLNLPSFTWNAPTFGLDLWGLEARTIQDLEIGVGWGYWLSGKFKVTEDFPGKCCLDGKQELIHRQTALLRGRFGVGIGIGLGVADLSMKGPTVNLDGRLERMSCGGKEWSATSLCVGPSITMGVDMVAGTTTLRVKAAGTATGGVNVCIKLFDDGGYCTFAKFTGEYDVSVTLWTGPFRLGIWGKTDSGEEYIYGEECAMRVE